MAAISTNVIAGKPPSRPDFLIVMHTKMATIQTQNYPPGKRRPLLFTDRESRP